MWANAYYMFSIFSIEWKNYYMFSHLVLLMAWWGSYYFKYLYNEDVNLRIKEFKVSLKFTQLVELARQ